MGMKMYDLYHILNDNVSHSKVVALWVEMCMTMSSYHSKQEAQGPVSLT